MKRFLLLSTLFVLLFTGKGYSQFVEDFEGGIPADWTTFKTLNGAPADSMGNVPGWTTSTTNTCQGTTSAYIDRTPIGAGNIAEGWLVTPQIIVPPNGRLYFTAKQSFAVDYGTEYVIRVSTTSQTDMSSFVDLQVYNETDFSPFGFDTCFEHGNSPIINLTPYAGDPIYIAFVKKTPPQPAAAPYADRWILDMVKVLEQCMPPTNLGAVAGSTTATLNWTGTASDGWEVEVLEGTNVPGTGSPTHTGTDVPFEVTGLSDSTPHTYYVRANCGDSTSPWAGPFIFTTNQIPVNIEGPGYSTDFESVTHGWQISNGTQTNKWVVGTAVSNSPSHALYISNTDGSSNNYSNTSTSYVQAYRDVQIPADAEEIYFSFDWRGMGDSNDYFKLWHTPVIYTPIPGVQMTPLGTGGGVMVGGSTANHFNNPGWINKGYVINVTAYQGQVRRFVFEWRNNNSGGVQPPGAIDNINISVITCTAPSGLAVSGVTTNEATFTWTAPASAPASYDYYITPDPSTPNSATEPTEEEVVGTTVTPTTLQPSTSYYFWVRSNCGADGVSFWVGPIAFSTPPEVFDLEDEDYETGFDTGGNPGWTLSNGTQVNKWSVGTATSNSPSSSLYISNNNGANNNYTIEAASIVHAYKDFAVPAGTTEIFLSYDWKNTGQANADYIRVWTVPASYAPLSGTQITAGVDRQQFGGNHAGQSNWTPASYILPATNYADNVVRLIFEWRNDASGGAQPPGAIDNINFSVITCPAPSGITAGTITDSTAEISWTGTSPLYEYYYSTSPTNPTAATPFEGETPDSNITLTGLDEGTVYYFWVRGNCGTLAGESFWTGPFTFWTPQIAIDLPYYQDYEDEDIPGMMLFSGTQTNKWIVGTATSSSPTHSSYISFDGIVNSYTGTTSIVHTYRTFTVPAGTAQLGISYDWKGTGDNADHMNVWLVPTTYTPTPGMAITPASGGTLLAGIQNNQPSWKNNVHVVDATIGGIAGTNRRLVFEWRNDTSVTNPPAAIDNIVIKVITCPQPTAISASNITESSAILEWTEQGSATQWEYVVLPIGSGLPGANPAGGVIVDVADAESWDAATGEASFEVTGLTSGVLYVYYVRAICGTDDVSFWTGPFTLLVNDECDGAITVPVNPNLQCAEFASGTIWGATASGGIAACGGGVADDDVWFVFEATSTLHILNFNNVIGSALYGTLYADSGDDCIAMVQQQCITANQTNLNGLTVGQTYKLRVYTQTAIPNQTTTFDVCITTPGPPIYASITDYTVTELVTEVLIDSDCAQVSNITWSTGSNFGSVNGIGYFEENNSGFPFEYGLVLSTGGAASVPGPNSTTLGEGNTSWPADSQLTTYLNAIIGTNTYYNATVLEFDFIPLISDISFDFMFASEEYGTFQCSYSDSFAFFLTNTVTGVTTNLALVPGTNDPISVVTIRDNAYNTGCPSANVDYFGAYYPVSATGGAPVNFNGITVPMVAEATVSPGTTYHIKLVIQDRGDSSFDSAVFLNGGSFNIGDIELGIDLTVDENTALCVGAEYLLQSGLDQDEYDFVWYHNGDLLDGATGPDLTVSDPGEYMVEASLPNSVCTISDSVIIEFYPPFQLELSEPDDLYICDDTETAIFDLTQNIPVILEGLDITDYVIEFFVTQEDAEAGTNAIANPEAYEGYNDQTIYVLALQISTGCTALLDFNLFISPLGEAQNPEFDYPTHIFCSLEDEVLVSLTPEAIGGTYTGTPAGLSINATTGTISISGSTPGIYEVTYAVEENACTAAASHTITIEIIEPAPVDVSFSYDEVCINALSDPLPILVGGFEMGGIFSSGSLDVNPTSGEVNLDTATIGTHEITYTIDANAENCTEAGTYTATIAIVEGTPSVTDFSYDAVYCYSDETAVPVMVADYTEGGTFSATPAGLNINAQTGVIDVTTSTPGTYVVTYAVSEDPEICLNAGSSNFTVTIFGEVPVAITDECRGNAYWIIVSPVDDSYLESEVIDYTWIINDVSTVTDVPEFNISANMGDNTVPLEVTVIVNNGCDNYTQFTVTSTSCMIQKGISPNGDDTNEYFDLTGMGVKKLSIYSRYGREVYTKSNYVKEWNGQDKNDNELPTGTYFYSIERSNGEHVTGWIYVNRSY